MFRDYYQGDEVFLHNPEKGVVPGDVLGVDGDDLIAYFPGVGRFCFHRENGIPTFSRHVGLLVDPDIAENPEKLNGYVLGVNSQLSIGVQL